MSKDTVRVAAMKTLRERASQRHDELFEKWRQENKKNPMSERQAYLDGQTDELYWVLDEIDELMADTVGEQ